MTDQQNEWKEIEEINKDYRSFICEQIDSRCENNICSIHKTLLDQIRREEREKTTAKWRDVASRSVDCYAVVEYIDNEKHFDKLWNNKRAKTLGDKNE